MPRLDYVRQTPEEISVTYADMPPMTEVLFVSTTSGEEKTPSSSIALSDGGGGAADIPIPSDPALPKGRYYLLALNRHQKYLAQTVPFYIN